jgi:hypothetical protein
MLKSPLNIVYILEKVIKHNKIRGRYISAVIQLKDVSLRFLNNTIK